MTNKTKDLIKIVAVFLAIVATVGIIGSLFPRNNGGGVKAPFESSPSTQKTESTVIPDESTGSATEATESSTEAPKETTEVSDSDLSTLEPNPQYAVEITFSTDASNGQSTYIGVYDTLDLSNQLYYEYLVGTETMTPKTITVYTSTGKLYIDSMYSIDTYSFSYGITLDHALSNGDVGMLLGCSVTADGTITLELDAD